MKPSALLSIAIALVFAAPALEASMPTNAPADVGAGKKRAATCFACHGEDGVSKIPGTPHLAGQDRIYLEKSLRAYRDGSRNDPAMTAMAKPLSDVDIANIAAYFAQARRRS